MMNHYQVTFETWNKLASLYEEKFMHLDLYNETYDQFCQSIEKNNATILDIGCGPGNISKYLLTKRPDWQLHGIDIAPTMIELAQKNNPTASFEVLDSRNILQLNKKFDGIMCGFCVPYLTPEDCVQMIADAAKLLHTNGTIYLSFVPGDPAKSGFQTGSTGDKSYFHFYTNEFLIDALLANEFASVQTFEVDYVKSVTEKDVHTILLARKK